MASLTASLRLPLLFALGAFACRSAPLYQPAQVSLQAPAGAKLSQVARSIEEAGTSLGWSMKEQSPGVIDGVLDRRRHRCEVAIHFDTQTFSILYANSENLDFDAEEETIHKGYNKWVANLERRIVQRASRIAR